MPNISLNFINNSNDINNSQIVIFQQNAGPSISAIHSTTPTQQIAVAWKVIFLGAKGSNHPFNFPTDVSVSASDSFGNQTPILSAQNGNRFDMIGTPKGNQLQLNAQHPAVSNLIEVWNELAVGAINANVYRDGRLLATKTGVVPGQKAQFQFEPTIFIGVENQIQEGTIMNITALSNINAQFSLIGISSADIVLTGGGTGKDSMPYKFSLQNVKFG
jgi:hypothetical protein